MQTVNIGEVTVFDNPQPNKEQALKVLEEAAEVFGAWQNYESSNGEVYEKEALRDEIADTIQACANLAYAFGREDLQPVMKDCKQRNIDRGRITPDEPEPELKPCPFCGSKARIEGDSIFCLDLNCPVDPTIEFDESSPESKAEAIKAWNKRAGEEK